MTAGEADLDRGWNLTFMDDSAAGGGSGPRTAGTAAGDDGSEPTWDSDGVGRGRQRQRWCWATVMADGWGWVPRRTAATVEVARSNGMMDLQATDGGRQRWVGGEGLGRVMAASYTLTFAIGAGPVTGLIIPELSSNRTRGKIMGFSLSAHWVCNFLVGLFFLELVDKVGVAPVYAGFGAVSLLSAAFAYYFVVETKGRSLEEIERSLNRSFPLKDE